MSDLDGNMVTTIITDSLEEPRAIALHPSKGYNNGSKGNFESTKRAHFSAGCFGRTGEKSPVLSERGWMAPTGQPSSPRLSAGLMVSP